MAVDVNGEVCKDPKKVTADDFAFAGLRKEGNRSNPFGLVGQIPGINTLGISIGKFDFERGGLIPPHTHPRASEIFTLLRGKLPVGFVTSNPDNSLISKVLKKSDVFVFPQGLVHFQKNIGNGKAVAISGLSSKNPGTNTIGNVVFGCTPSIPEAILAKSFQVDKSVVNELIAPF